MIYNKPIILHLVNTGTDGDSPWRSPQSCHPDA